MVLVEDGNIEQAITKFRKRSQGILSELKFRQGFESRNERRKRKDRIALRRKKKREKRMKEAKGVHGRR